MCGEAGAYSGTHPGHADASGQDEPSPLGSSAGQLTSRGPDGYYRRPCVETDSSTSSRATAKYRPPTPVSVSPTASHNLAVGTQAQGRKSSDFDVEPSSASSFGTESGLGRSPVSSRTSMSPRSPGCTSGFRPDHQSPASHDVVDNRTAATSAFEADLTSATHHRLPSSPGTAEPESSGPTKLSDRSVGLHHASNGDHTDDTIDGYSSNNTAARLSDRGVDDPHTPRSAHTPTAPPTFHYFDDLSDKDDSHPRRKRLSIDEGFWTPGRDDDSVCADRTGTSRSGGTDPWSLPEPSTISTGQHGSTGHHHQPLHSSLGASVKKGRKQLTLNLTLASPTSDPAHRPVSDIDTSAPLRSFSSSLWGRLTSATRSIFPSLRRRSPAHTPPTHSIVDLETHTNPDTSPPQSAVSSCSFCSTAASLSHLSSRASSFFPSSRTNLKPPLRIRPIRPISGCVLGTRIISRSASRKRTLGPLARRAKRSPRDKEGDQGCRGLYSKRKEGGSGGRGEGGVERCGGERGQCDGECRGFEGGGRGVWACEVGWVGGWVWVRVMARYRVSEHSPFLLIVLLYCTQLMLGCAERLNGLSK